MNGRHRHQGPLSRFLTQAAGFIAAAAALVTAFAVSDLRPPPPHRPFIVTNGPFGIQILSSRQASAIKAGPTIHDTRATWLILTIEITATQAPATVGYAAVKTADGTTYLASRRVPQPLIDGTRLLQPGIALHADIAFEIPRYTLNQLTAEFAPAPDPALGAVSQHSVPSTGPWLIKPPQAELAPATVNP